MFWVGGQLRIGLKFNPRGDTIDNLKYYGHQCGVIDKNADEEYERKLIRQLENRRYKIIDKKETK